jgi:xanthine/CO dehydrogenase XdhC/CoxF family maturation factor
MSARRILEAFERWRSARVPLVLGTVAGTEGSTYTKAGHRILLTGTGEFQGLVSGGCLEGDLAEHARGVIASGQAQLLTYDLRDENDELFGLGIGCNGLFRILLQPLRAESDYAPFADIARAWMGDAAVVAATVVDSSDPELPAGATIVTLPDALSAWRVPDTWRARLLATTRELAGARDPSLVTETLDQQRARVLYAPIRPIPRLLILGAGLDAVPLIDIATRLGWRVTVADHRLAHLARGDLRDAERALRVDAKQVSHDITLTHYAAAVVMSHHLETDRAYLAALADSAIPYVGLLGPVARRERLLDDLGAAGRKLADRLHAPVGLQIGADSPETIALAILTEIHAGMTHRSGAVTRSSRS